MFKIGACPQYQVTDFVLLAGGQQLNIDSHPETAGSARAHTGVQHHRSMSSTAQL